MSEGDKRVLTQAEIEELASQGIDVRSNRDAKGNVVQQPKHEATFDPLETEDDIQAVVWDPDQE